MNPHYTATVFSKSLDIDFDNIKKLVLENKAQPDDVIFTGDVNAFFRTRQVIKRINGFNQNSKGRVW